MPAPVTTWDPNIGDKIAAALNWLRGNKPVVSPTDIGQGLAVRGPQTLGRTMLAIPKGVAMAATDLVENPPDPSLAFGLMGKMKGPRTMADLMAENAQRSRAYKEARAAHLQAAFDAGEIQVNPDGTGRFKTTQAAQKYHLRMAQEADRLQPADAPVSGAQRVGAVFDTLTGGNPLSGDYTGAYTTGKADIDPSVANDTTGWVRPQTTLGALSDQAVPLAWSILAGKAMLAPGAAGSGLEGLGKLGLFQAGKTYPESYALARSNPEITPGAAHNYAMTHAAVQGLLPVLGVSRVGVGPLGRGLKSLTGVSPAITSFVANQALTGGEAAAMTVGEGRANQYIDPSAPLFSGSGFLRNLGMMEGMTALHSGYDALKAKTAEAAPAMTFGDPSQDVGKTPQQLEGAFQALKGRNLSEQLSLRDWLMKMRESHNVEPEHLLTYLDTARAQAQGSKIQMPPEIDVPKMQAVAADPEFQKLHRRLYDLHARTQEMKGLTPAPYDPNYVPRVLMTSPYADLPTGPATGGGIAKTGAGVNRARSYMALEDVAGGRTVVDDHGNRVYAYDPEGGDPTVFRKSRLGIEAQPVVGKMIRSLKDIVGYRDQEMNQELTRMESELNLRAKDYEAATTKLEAAQESNPTDIEGIDRLMQNQNDAAEAHSTAMDQLEAKLLKIRNDKLKDPKSLVALDPRAAGALQSWNEASGELNQMRRNFGSGPDWSRQPIYRKIGTGSRDWSENLHKMTQATTRELHDQLPGVKYREDPFLNLIQGTSEAYGAHGGTQVLDALINNPEFSAKIGEPNFYDPEPHGGRPWEEASREVLARAPMLKGYRLEPRVNQLLEVMAKGTNPDGFLKQMGDLYLDLGFANPTVHWHNMLAHFVKTGGAGLFTPKGAATMARHLEAARISLQTGDDTLRDFAANGGTIMTRKTLGQNWDSLFKGQEDIGTRAAVQLSMPAANRG